MSWFEAQSSPSALAFVTTVHAALLILRLHRSAGVAAILFGIPGVVFCGLPWVLGAPAWLLAVFVAHAAWFVAVEKLGRPEPARVVTASVEGQTAAIRSASPAPSRPRDGAAAIEVLDVQVETAAIRTFRFERPRGFEFQAGQFLPLLVEIEGRTHVRCYSISSSPDATGYLEISVRRQGLVSGWLHDHAARGGQLRARPPAGHFVYPSDSTHPILLVAGGIGITPMLSMLRYGVASEPRRPIALLYSVKTASDLAFEEELALIARRHPQVTLVCTVTGAETPGRHRAGRIDEGLLRSVIAEPARTVCLMCGPTAMLETLKALLQRLGMPASQVRSEAFEAAVAFGATAPPGSVLSPAAGSICTLRFQSSGIETRASRSVTLLEAAEQAGADIPSLCRAGACGTCRTRLVSGDVEGTVEGSDEERFVLPCVTRPLADCTLEA